VLWDRIEDHWQQLLSLGLSTADIYTLLVHLLPSAPPPTDQPENNFDAQISSITVDARLQLLSKVAEAPPLSPDQYQELLTSRRIREDGGMPVPVAGPREYAAAQRANVVHLMRNEDTVLERIVVWQIRNGSTAAQVWSTVSGLSMLLF
jgi:hypothetical protein